MSDQAHVVGHFYFAGGGFDAAGFASFPPQLDCGVDKGRTAKSFIDCNSESASQITIEITLKNGLKTKAVIDLR